MATIATACVSCKKEFSIRIDKIKHGKNNKTYQCINCYQVNIFEYQLTLEKGNKLYKNKDWLKNKYHDENLNMSEIGNICGVSAMTIRDWLNKHDLSVRPRGYNKK